MQVDPETDPRSPVWLSAELSTELPPCHRLGLNSVVTNSNRAQMPLASSHTYKGWPAPRHSSFTASSQRPNGKSVNPSTSHSVTSFQQGPSHQMLGAVAGLAAMSSRTSHGTHAWLLLTRQGDALENIEVPRGQPRSASLAAEPHARSNHYHFPENRQTTGISLGEYFPPL